jgi:hypothetical protein
MGEIWKRSTALVLRCRGHDQDIRYLLHRLLSISARQASSTGL